MKYLLLLAVIVAVLWFARSRSGVAQGRKPTPTPPPPQPMLACAHCGVHLPRAEMVAGLRGLYCTEAHRLARGDIA